MSISPAATGNEEVWRAVFGQGHPKLKQFQRFHNRLPSPPRCRMCFAPFAGIGGAYMRLRGKGPSRHNPHYCNACDAFITSYPGGAEVELSILFVDVRNSVGIAERLGPTAYGRMMRSYYVAATRPVIDTDGFIIDFIGDAVAGIYPPGFCGPAHARKAIQAAERLISSPMPSHPDGAELLIGVGVHTGPVFIGSVAGADGGSYDVQPLGDSVNVAARLSGLAAPGEALISDATFAAAGIADNSAQTRQVDLKGRATPIAVRAIRRDSPPLNL